MSADDGPILEGDSIISSGDGVRTAPQAEPLLNQDVIGEICKFLDTPDIKNCRLVATLWNYGATPVLKSRTRTTLAFSPGHDDNGDPFDEPDFGGWDISDVVKKLEFGPLNVRLAIPSTHEYNLPRPDFSRFPVVNNFKSVIFEYPVGEKFGWQRELITKLILSSSTTLEQLKSALLEDEVPLDFPPLGGTGTIFPKLMKLKVDQLFYSYGAIKRIGQAVRTSFPNLKHLKTKCEHLDGMSEDGLLQNLPASLTGLKLVGDLDTNGLECLLKIPAGLKKLVFGDSSRVDYKIDGREDELSPILYKLLKKHAPTLVELDIAISWLNEGKKVEWKFPVFPTLKKITIDYCNLLETVVFETSLESGHFGGINYPVCFPVLEVLHIFANAEDSSKPESFFPGRVNGPVVQSVKDVIVDVRIDDTDAGLIEQAVMLVWLMVRFPNAEDKLMKDLQELRNIK